MLFKEVPASWLLQAAQPFWGRGVQQFNFHLYSVSFLESALHCGVLQAYLIENSCHSTTNCCSCSYMTFSLMAAAELMAMCASAFLVDRLGRHNIITFGLLLGGAACLGCANAQGQQVAQAVLAVIGKFGCASKWWWASCEVCRSTTCARLPSVHLAAELPSGAL